MLLNTVQVAEKYNVSPYTVTQSWVAKGLKHIQGKRKKLFVQN